MGNNERKAVTYKYAFDRMKEALDKGFFLEATAIAESIVTDRLFSYLRGGGRHAQQRADRVSFGWCLRSLANEPAFPRELLSECDAFRKERNTVLHSLAKSDPGTPTMSPDEFLQLAGTTAAKGRRLARKVADWHREQRAVARRTERT